MARRIDQKTFGCIRFSESNEDGLWYESPEYIEAQVRWGYRKAMLLNWVFSEMERMSRPQRQYIALRYFHDKTYRDIAVIMGVYPSTACRVVRTGIARLRRMARLEGL